jgi:topoisomerase-4 subunit A
MIADKKTVISAIYKNCTTGQAWGKRFVIDKFILQKTYKYLDEKSELLYFSAYPEPTVELSFAATAHQKAKKLLYALKQIPVKKVQTRGMRLASQKIKKVTSSH